MGKCLAGSTLIYDPRDGSRRRIDDLVAAHERGEEIEVVSLGADHQLRRSSASAAIRSGIQPVYRLTTAAGRSIDASGNHPLLTPTGWRELGALRPGVQIAAPLRLAHAAAHRFPLHGAAPGGLSLAEELMTCIPVADVCWDPIVAIEPLGDQETYDLTVPGDHNFVANDLIVHNSALMANFAENAALGSEKAVALFSLEMSESELAQRFIASQASIKGDDLRKGKVPASRWAKIMEASNRLAKSPLFIDDSSDLSVLDVRAKARRLLQQHADGLGLILIDYLQLMRGDGRTDNRVEQIGQISRGLKTLARELDCPVIALSQLNRGVEQRTDKRPVLSDLRESGCLTGDTRVFLPDAGVYRRMDELVGKRDFRVMALNRETWKLEPARVSNAFSTGRKPVFTLRTKPGRRIRATANHRFLTVDGWHRLDELGPDMQIASPNAAAHAHTAPVLVSSGGAAEVGRVELCSAADDEVFWDRIASIEPDGEEEVYDLTVDRLHNFVAEDVIVHNSIEQDADVVMFIYRDEYYDQESEREGIADLIVSKHRNGGLATVELTFQKEYPRFMSYVGDDRY